MFLGLSGVPLIMVPDNNAQEMFFRKINSKTLGVFFCDERSLQVRLGRRFRERWGPSASEGPQKHDLTMFLEYNV
jgi:hypothetical protein